MKTMLLEGADLEIAALQQQEGEAWIQKQNVVGVGVGRKILESRRTASDEPCLTVLVTHKLDLSELSEQDRVPEQIGKYRTDVLTVGQLFAGGGEVTSSPVPRSGNGKRNGTQARRYEAYLPPVAPPLDTPPEPPALQVDAEVLRGKVRPAQGGYSVAHPRVTAGTIATGVVDLAALPGMPSRYYLLSNNHVLANSNAAGLGDPILQPGPADGGTFPADVIGRLSRFVPIKFGGPDNMVDAAIAEVPFHDLNREIYWIGYPERQIAAVRVGQDVQKTGRTTNYTQGRVQVVNASVNVNYGGGRVARFIRQIVTTAMSAGGDSGSLVLDLQDRPVGLLFAGSNVATIINPIALVQSLLGVRIAF